MSPIKGFSNVGLPNVFNCGIHYFCRFRITTSVYSCCVAVCLCFIIVITTINTVEKRSLIEPMISEQLAKPQIPEEFSELVDLREETSASTAGGSCQPLHFIPHAETRPVTALVSFPGSGNTWLRYLIQQSTGFLTGSQFVDETLMSNGFPGEAVFNASVAVVKTHERGKKTREQFQKAVLLIRRPKPAIQSMFNLYSRHSHTGCASEGEYERDNGNLRASDPGINPVLLYLRSATPLPKPPCPPVNEFVQVLSRLIKERLLLIVLIKGLDWKRFVKNNLNTWKVTNTDWIKTFKGPLHVVLYEDLLNELGPTLRSLVQFLDLPLNETALQCTVENSEGLYHRNSCINAFDPFTEDMNDRINEEEAYVFKTIQAYENIRKYLS